MEEKIYENLWELFIDFKSKNTEMRSVDDPKRLLLGWGTHKYMQVGYARLSAIRSRKALHMPFDIPGKGNSEKKLTELIVSSEGRNQIAAYLSHELIIPEFDAINRIINLKAFW